MTQLPVSYLSHFCSNFYSVIQGVVTGLTCGRIDLDAYPLTELSKECIYFDVFLEVHGLIGPTSFNTGNY